MSLRTYILSVSLIYMTLFGLVLALDWPPPIGPIKAVAVTVGGSVFVAWAGTERMMDICPDTSPRYLGPSLVHGAIIAVMIGTIVFAFVQ